MLDLGEEESVINKHRPISQFLISLGTCMFYYLMVFVETYPLLICYFDLFSVNGSNV